MWKSKFFAGSETKSTPTAEKHTALLSCYERWLAQQLFNFNSSELPSSSSLSSPSSSFPFCRIIDGFAGAGRYGSPTHSKFSSTIMVDQEAATTAATTAITTTAIGDDAGSPLLLLEGLRLCCVSSSPSEGSTVEAPDGGIYRSNKYQGEEESCAQKEKKKRNNVNHHNGKLFKNNRNVIEVILVENRAENFTALCGHVEDWCRRYDVRQQQLRQNSRVNVTLALPGEEAITTIAIPRTTAMPARKEEKKIPTPSSKFIDVHLDMGGTQEGEVAVVVIVTIRLLFTSFSEFANSPSNGTTTSSPNYSSTTTPSSATCMDKLQEEGHPHPTFLFIDPYGCDGVSCSDIGRVLNGGGGDRRTTCDLATSTITTTEVVDDHDRAPALNDHPHPPQVRVGRTTVKPHPPACHLVMHMATTSMHRKAISKNGAGERQRRRMGEMLGGAHHWDQVRASAAAHSNDPLKGHAAVKDAWLAALVEGVVAQSGSWVSPPTTSVTELRGGNTHMITLGTPFD